MMRWMVLLWLVLEVPVAAASSLPLESEHFEAGRGLGQTFVAPSAFDKQQDFLDQQSLHIRKLEVSDQAHTLPPPTPKTRCS